MGPKLIQKRLVLLKQLGGHQNTGQRLSSCKLSCSNFGLWTVVARHTCLLELVRVVAVDF